MIGRETGFSFSKLLLGMRLMEAALFLQDDNIKIGLAGEKAGFKDYRYFSQVFRKIFGTSPGEFRKDKGFHKNYRIKQILDMIQEKK
jgi:AraC-like DNA-binding protein